MPAQDVADWTPVHTRRLILRRPEAADEPAALDLHTDPRTNVHHPAPRTVTRASSARIFHEIGLHWYRHGFGVWAVSTLDDPQTLIGFTGLSHRLVHARPALNLYYRYLPEAWGRGYATEGAREAVRRAEEFLPGLPVVAYTTADNIGSQHTAVAAGLVRREDLDVDRGTYRDIYLARGWYTERQQGPVG
ncbi:GNAT family N-acetyltransferase [Arthrobacter sp. APC 3897]|uniref:GNAT family N-acetyltransferase n=1 Tax=Arthrobacter sp. APC 3897 TaxID=3035204 RepID=UPI0025B3773B|nr:GNAT family N-acetyltransferase [Arthrobacter sp. APC 3897]MDN3483218.1 GNAT family N-acetyltransferase [Arthrobacter sp. APC 3897]